MSNDVLLENSKRVTKAIYLVLLKYHARTSLGLHAWWKPPGHAYFTFRILAAGDFAKNPFSPAASLTMYQGRLATPGWSKAGLVEHPEFEKRRISTDEMVAWVEGTFRFDREYQAHRTDIDWWRRATSADAVERYLFAWNILGLLSTGGAIYTHGGSEDSESYEIGDADKLARLRCDNAFEQLHYVGKIGVCTSGFASLPPSHSPLNIWSKYLDGMTKEAIVALLASHSDK